MQDILESDEEKIYENNRKIFPLKFYQLLPESCKILEKLDTNERDFDEKKSEGVSIETVKSLRFEKDHVGKRRNFVLTIYKIRKGSVCYHNSF